MDRPRRRQGLAWRDIDGMVVIVDPVSSMLHDLSEVASFYWLLMDGEHTVDELASGAVGEFDVDRATAESDLRELLGELAAKGLLEA